MRFWPCMLLIALFICVSLTAAPQVIIEPPPGAGRERVPVPRESPRMPMERLRGEVSFPLYPHLGVRGNAEAEVWLDGAYVFTLRAGSGKVYELSGSGNHTFSAQVYALGREGKTYLGCTRGSFTVDSGFFPPPGYGQVLFAWRLVIPPPSPIC